MTVQEYNKLQDKRISEMLEISESEAEKSRLATQRVLSCKKGTWLYEQEFYCRLVCLCYYMGAKEFSKSLLFKMLAEQRNPKSNIGYTQSDLNRVHECTLLYYQDKAQPLWLQ